MDDSQFDDLTRTLFLPSRRGLLTTLAPAVLAANFRPDADDARARRKKKKKKVTVCHNGQTIQVSKKSRKAHLAHGDTIGPCPTCDCDDGVACTDDVCTASGTCTYTPNDSLCGTNQLCDSVEGCRCRVGFRNCSGNPADGCECQTPNCCRVGGACQTTHATGLGQSFYDCVDLATYDETQAEKARTAYAAEAGPGTIFNGFCGDVGSEQSATLCHDPNDNDGPFGSICACWAYSGPLAGRVGAIGGPNPCVCPTLSDPSWN